ncbi:hypothetical protein AAVH_17325 [Aphelenchoides avenae]|nr:hypothetical protein AAVH_17325 [Aphelenchus avenae]
MKTAAVAILLAVMLLGMCEAGWNLRQCFPAHKCNPAIDIDISNARCKQQLANRCGLGVAACVDLPSLACIDACACVFPSLPGK